MDLDAAFTQAKQLLMWELEELHDEYHMDGMTVSEVDLSPQGAVYVRYLLKALQNTLTDIRIDEAHEDETVEETQRALQETFNG